VACFYSAPLACFCSAVDTQIVENGPIPAIHGVVRCRLIDLARWLHDEFGVSLTETAVGRELKKLGYVKLIAPAPS